MRGRERTIDMSLPADLPTPRDKPFRSPVGLAIDELFYHLPQRVASASTDPKKLAALRAERENLLIGTVIAAGLASGDPNIKIGFHLDNPDASTLKVKVSKRDGFKTNFPVEVRSNTRSPEHEALLARALFRARLRFEGSSQ